MRPWGSTTATPERKSERKNKARSTANERKTSGDDKSSGSDVSPQKIMGASRSSKYDPSFEDGDTTAVGTARKPAKFEKEKLAAATVDDASGTLLPLTESPAFAQCRAVR